MPPKRKNLEDESPSETASVPGTSTIPAPPAPKRQRVSRACDQCRAAREKCDGKQPVCFPCVSQNRPCTYEVNPKKRGVQTGYIRTLELALAWIFEKVPGSEDVLGTLLAQEGGQGHGLLSGKDKADSDRLHRRWRKSRIHKDIERVLSGGGPSQSPDKTSPSDEGSDSEADTPVIKERSGAVQQVSNVVPPSPDSLTAKPWPQTPMNGDPALLRPPSPPGVPTRTPHSSKIRLKLPPNSSRLLQVYLSYTHSWFPILERTELYQNLYMYNSEEGLNVSLRDTEGAAHAELWSVLALASFQESVSTSMVTGAMDPGAMSPSQIYQTARGLVPSEEGPFQLQHVRALLLLGLVNLGRDNMSSAWFLVGMAIRIFLDLSSRRENSTNAVESAKKKMQSTFIACFMLDTIMSTLCDKTPYLKTETLAEALPISENDLDEWQTWQSCPGFGPSDSRGGKPARSLSAFNQLYAIFKILSTDKTLRASKPAADPDSRVVLRSRLEEIMSSGPKLQPFAMQSVADLAPVPSSYIVNIVYLWARTILTGLSKQDLHLIIETIGKYEARFGTCGAPPFFSTCLSSLASPDDPSDSLHEARDLVLVVKARLSSIWTSSDQPLSAPRTAHRPEEITSSTSHEAPEPPTNPPEARPADPALNFSTPTPSMYYNHATSPNQPRPSTSRSYTSLDPSPYILTAGFPQSRPILDTSITSMPQRGNPLDHPTIMDTPALNDISQHHHHPHLPMAPRANFDGSMPLDYDRILDDFGSVDFTDRTDGDPRFLVNLGFQPGADLAELLSRDYSGP